MNPDEVANVFGYVVPKLNDGWQLSLTCCACPEQYDLIDPDGIIVGYFRLRSGRFTVHLVVGDKWLCAGPLVYYAFFPDEPLKGGFDDDTERAEYLTAGVSAIQEWMGLPVSVQVQLGCNEPCRGTLAPAVLTTGLDIDA